MIVAEILFPLALPLPLRYRLTPDQSVWAKPGVFVRAPLGNRTLLGIIASTSSQEERIEPEHTEKFKFVTSLETHFFAISSKRLSLWKWISDYYLCSPGEVMKAAVSSHPPIIADLDDSVMSTPSLPTLTPEQLSAYKEMQPHIAAGNVVLLQADRQRTNLYLYLLQQTLSSGKNALLLIPELGAGEQQYRYIQTCFDRRVFLFHSQLTPAKRRKTLQDVANQTTPFIVVGSRSALLFIDYKELGLIIIDEEQDHSFKQNDPAPRFHARDLALFMGRLYRAPVVLGSSCPSLESEYNVHAGRYHSVLLSSSTFSPPKIEMVDTLRLSKKKQMYGLISKHLFEALNHCLTQKKQALLFSSKDELLRQQLQLHFPDARIVSLHDFSNLQKRHNQLLQFKNKESDILIGSPTLHKNLDFGQVALTAILDVDPQLSRQDFRAHERTYQTLTALAAWAPLLILQTDQPDHPLYGFLQKNNLQDFVREQLAERKNFHYPPFVRLVA
ncbi:MAG: hypothetical protein FWG54_01215, partial [Bacteroidetes bacterium]|nr:hypothetical protein [Bacteroidota bacterium]